MLDLGWQELLLIGVVALVVVGPKDLPKALRTGARLLNKARAMSREFQSGLAEMAREAELEEIRTKVKRAAQFDLGEELRKSADPHGKLSAEFDPTDFNRKLKESVEAGPPQHPAGQPDVAPAAADAGAEVRPHEKPVVEPRTADGSAAEPVTAERDAGPRPEPPPSASPDDARENPRG